MALVGSLLFCTDCGNLLDRQPPAEPQIICTICNTVNKSELILLMASRFTLYLLTFLC